MSIEHFLKPLIFIGIYLYTYSYYQPVCSTVICSKQVKKCNPLRNYKLNWLIVYIWPCLKPYYCQTTLVNHGNFSAIFITLQNSKKKLHYVYCDFISHGLIVDNV